MSFDELVSFVGFALVWSLAGTALTIAALRFLHREAPLGRVVPAAMALLFFVALTQTPFPDPARMSCPVRTAAPQLHPFAWVEGIGYLWRRRAPLWMWLENQGFLAVVMNFLVCALIGALLARAGLGLRAVILTGAALTLGVELTQLTGTWGIFPCAYRRFDIDDLILNFSGTATGGGLWYLLARRRQRP